MLPRLHHIPFVMLLAACGGDDAPPVDGGPGSDGGRLDGTTPTDAPTGADGGPGVDGGPGDDGGPGVDAPGTDGGCASCLETGYSFGWDGGLVPERRRARIEPCRDFTHTRTMLGSGTMRSCTNEVPGCNDSSLVDVGELVAAFAHPDVVAAFAAAPVLYGEDTRPVDGAVFQIEELGGEIVSVGIPCRPGGGACTPIPPGVMALRDLLEQLETERLAEPDCDTVFPL